MIAQVFSPATSFRRVCWYVCQDRAKAEILDLEGVRGHDHRLMARDFETIHSLSARNKPVFHGVLLFHQNEKLYDAQRVDIAKKYLAELLYINTQHAIVKHNDTRRVHLHLVANRIGYDGRYIDSYPEVVRSKQALEKLIPEYDLIPAGKKDLRQTNWDGLDNPQLKRYFIYNHIRECLPGSPDMETLEQRLSRRGIGVQYHISDKTGQRQGISFRYKDQAFSGSGIDPGFSFSRLQKSIAQQLSIGQWEEQQRSLGQKLAREEQLAREQRQEELRGQQELQQQQEQALRQGHSRGQRIR